MDIMQKIKIIHSVYRYVCYVTLTLVNLLCCKESIVSFVQVCCLPPAIQVFISIHNIVLYEKKEK